MRVIKKQKKSGRKNGKSAKPKLSKTLSRTSKSSDNSSSNKSAPYKSAISKLTSKTPKSPKSLKSPLALLTAKLSAPPTPSKYKTVSNDAKPRQTTKKQSGFTGGIGFTLLKLRSKWKYLVIGCLAALIIVLFTLIAMLGVQKTGFAGFSGQPSGSAITLILPIMAAIIICSLLLVFGKSKSDADAIHGDEYELEKMSGRDGRNESVPQNAELNNNFASSDNAAITQISDHSILETKTEEELLRKYIKKELAKGFSKEDIRKALIGVEWDKDKVDAELNNLCGDEKRNEEKQPAISVSSELK